MALPEGAISNAEMVAFLALSTDEQSVQERLIQLTTEKRPDGITRIRPFLDRLQDYTRTSATAAQAQSIISALIIVGDKLLISDDEPNTMFGFGTEVSVSRVIYQLLHILEEEERFNVLQSAIERSESIFMIVQEVALLERDDGEPSSVGNELISEDHLNQLKEQASDEIRSAATDGLLMESPGLLTYLYRWKEWKDISEPKEWVEQQIIPDSGMLEFLCNTKVKHVSAGGNEEGTMVSYRIHLDQIEPELISEVVEIE